MAKYISFPWRAQGLQKLANKHLLLHIIYLAIQRARAM